MRKTIDFDLFFERVAKETGIASQQDLAAMLGVNRSAITQAKNRNAVPPKWLHKLACDYGLDPVWLETGTARRAAPPQPLPGAVMGLVPRPVRPRGATAGSGGAGAGAVGAARSAVRPGYGHGGPLGDSSGRSDAHGRGAAGEGFDALGFSHVPKVRARLCAGGGSFEVNGEIEGYYAFHSDWLRRKGHPESMVLMDVFGNSMEPEIREGDTVLIDEQRQEILAGGIYAVGVEDTVMVKRIEKRPGALALLSDNPDYSPILLKGEELATVRVIGKIVWVCREYR
ncbi:MAG: S24 family peptidase [Desulfovibrionaceae bacterium]